jgi:hypothetical protein
MNLAVSPCVCCGWRDIVDAHALLLPNVFLGEFRGSFAMWLHGFGTNFAIFDPPLSFPREKV